MANRRPPSCNILRAFLVRKIDACCSNNKQEIRAMVGSWFLRTACESRRHAHVYFQICNTPIHAGSGYEELVNAESQRALRGDRGSSRSRNKQFSAFLTEHTIERYSYSAIAAELCPSSTLTRCVVRFGRPATFRSIPSTPDSARSSESSPFCTRATWHCCGYQNSNPRKCGSDLMRSKTLDTWSYLSTNHK